MSVVTLAEFLKRTRPGLIPGVAETILTTNPMYYLMPWQGYAGQGFLVNAEAALGDADFYGLNDTIAAKAPSQVDNVVYTATRVIGDAEIDGKQVAESQSSENDLMQTEVTSKAKSVGRKIQEGMAVGTGADPLMNSFPSMTDPGQYVASTGDILRDLDSVGQKVLSKDGMIDFYMCNSNQILNIKQALRTSTGVPMIELTSGGRTIKVLEYNGVPIFTNNWIGQTETAGGAALTGGDLSSIYAGVFDDGTRKVGVSLIHPERTPAGIVVEKVGVKSDKDQQIVRVKSYVNFASFNKLGLARVTDCPK